MSTERTEPTQSGAAWPVFRHDNFNTGRSPLRGTYHGDQPWMFQTGKGVFSTPVIDNAGMIYVGSADHRFYALHPDGTPAWHIETGEIIDSAAALPAVEDNTPPKVLVPSGDGYLRCLDCASGDIVWTFDARVAPRASYNNWWEANIALGADGTIYAGNTNFNYYAINPGGTFRWAYETGANAWSAAAIADDGTLFWGSNDTFVHAVHANGERKWRKRTLGFIAASAALDTEGTLYIGSYDSKFYALDSRNGRVRWTFKTQDHIYSSAALSVDAQGKTDAICFGSADGNCYALDPQGRLLWRYDTGAPIRSSPVLGRKPAREPGWIVYFGCSNGKLYALDAATGQRRWSYDTTPDEPELRDRNDLNGSPALSHTGIVIGGEHGQVWYVPYDYPLHSDDPRGSTQPGEEFPQEQTALYYVTPGGNLRADLPQQLPTSTILTLRLIARGEGVAHENNIVHENNVARDKGSSREARLYNRPFLKPGRALQITVDPAFPFDAETSADGRHLHVIPRSFLTPGQTYHLHITGNTYTGGIHIGNLTLGGRRSGRFSQEITFHTAPAALDRIPLAGSAGDAQEGVSAIEITRFAVPIPTMLPSLNQIGFDYMDWIAGVVDVSEPDASGEGSLILWAVGGHRDKHGVLVVDPETDFVLPLSGRYRHDAFRLYNRGLKMRITGIPIPFNHFELRGRLDADHHVGESATAFADTQALGIPTFGPLLVLAGLANNWWQKLLAMATFVTRPYADGPANRRPEGITVRTLESARPTNRRAGHITAHFTVAPGTTYPLARHLPAILLIDEERREAVPLDYQANRTATSDAEGNVHTVTLALPTGTKLPEAVTAVVMLDVVPVHRRRLS